MSASSSLSISDLGRLLEGIDCDGMVVYALVVVMTMEVALHRKNGERVASVEVGFVAFLARQGFVKCKATTRRDIRNHLQLLLYHHISLRSVELSTFSKDITCL
jgi:hypothetical protein